MAGELPTPERIAELEQDVRKLRALEFAGVDNWSGYDYAMQILRELEEDDGQ